MKITIGQSQLVKALQSTHTLARSTTQMPILGNVLMVGEGKTLTVKSTDLTSGISISISATIEEEGRTLAPSGQFLEYVQALGAGDIHITGGSESIKVEQGSSSATFPTVNDSEYPSFLPDTKKTGATILLETLQNSIKAVGVAVAQDESRPQLTGFLFRHNPDKPMLHLVGTDGYRLAMVELEFPGEWGKDLLVPAKPLINLLKGWDGKEIELGYDKQNNQIWLKGEGREGVVRLLQGDFPDFSKIIPPTHTTQVQIGKEELLQAVQQLSVFARQNANIIQVEIGKTVKMSTQSSFSGSGAAEIEATIEGDPITIAFNYRYLREYLLSAADGMITIIFNGPLAPVKFTTQAMPELLHIIMPVKL